MKERNVDKIRRLEKELAAQKEKNSAANLELAYMREKVREKDRGVSEIQKAVNMILTAAALEHGARAADGAFELAVPMNRPGLLEHWSMTAARDEQRRSYVLRAEPRA